MCILTPGSRFRKLLLARAAAIFAALPVLAPSAAVAAMPTIASVVNGAEFQPGIAPGSWVTISGANLAATTRTWRSDEIVSGVLPTQLDGVSVTIDGRPAAVYYISPTQLNVQAPADSNRGPVPVQVTNTNGASTPFTAQLQDFSPAFFVWNGRNVVATRPDFSLVGPPGLFPNATTTPARPGEVIILWGTGFGPTDPPVPAGQVVNQTTALVANLTVQIGGMTAQVMGGGLSTGFAGLYQVAVRIPDAAPTGGLAVTVSAGGLQSPGNVVLAVQQ